MALADWLQAGLNRGVSWFAPRRDPGRLRVLYALDSYPQVSEAYIAAEIDYMTRAGVEVEVWRRHEPSSPGTSRVPIHEGRLARAIARTRPDVVHFHWFKTAVRHADIVARAGLSLTVRGHWHFDLDHIDRLGKHPAVDTAYLFPHAFRRLEQPDGRFEALPVSFSTDSYRPVGKKDPRLVVRTAAAKEEKDLALFLRVAARLPEHRFVLVIASLSDKNLCYPGLVALNRELGEPAEIRVDLEPEEVAEIIAPAGTYLHTYDPTVPFGMPVSIAESMATGSFVLARDVPGADEFLGDAGQLYTSEDEVVERIRATETWSDAEWTSARERSQQRAARHFADRVILPTLLSCWTDVKRRRHPDFEGPKAASVERVG